MAGLILSMDGWMIDKQIKSKHHFIQHLLFTMDEKRQEIAALLRAGVKQMQIMKMFKVSKTMVFNSKKQLEASGDAKGCHGGGRPRSVRTSALKRAVKAKIKRNSKKAC